jgi:type IV pilus assembly protein PilM
MVDWNKEVKLSDLIGRKQTEPEEAGSATPETETPSFATPEAPSPATPEAASPVRPEEPSSTTPVTPSPATPVTPSPAEVQLAVDLGTTPAPAPVSPLADSPAAPPTDLEQAADLGAAAWPELDAEPEERVPWYKREISLGRKSDKPKAEKPAKQPKEKKAKPKKEPKTEQPQGENVPFYKRELSFGGKTKSAKGSQKASQSVKRMKRITGLKIGGSQLAAAQIRNNGTPELVQLARQDLEPGIIVGGELRDPEALAEALKTFFKDFKLPRQDVRLGIANNRIGVRTFEIGGIADVKQLENAIRFRAHEALPIPIDEAVIDWHVLSEHPDDEGGITRRILLVVAYRDLVDRYVIACKKAGIKLVGIDLEAFALLRALAEPLPDEAGPSNAAVVVVAVGHDRSTFAVSDGRVCEFTRVLDWGGASLNIAIARELNIAPSEAEPIKRALSLTHGDIPEGLSEDEANRARTAVQRQLESFARELVSSLQFYQNQPGSLGIAELVLTGGTVHLHGLAEQLQGLIGVNVRVGDPLGRVTVGKKIKNAEQVGSLAIAIGLGIED